MELDIDENNEMEIVELQERMQDPAIAAYFSRIGVDVDEVHRLFVLLDRDESGSVDMNEFKFGCLKLQGPAKSFEIAILLHEVDAMSQNIRALGAALTSLMEQREPGIAPAAPDTLPLTISTSLDTYETV